MTKQRSIFDMTNIKSTLVGGFASFIIYMGTCFILSDSVNKIFGDNFGFILIFLWGIISLFLWGYLFNKLGGE